MKCWKWVRSPSRECGLRGACKWQKKKGRRKEVKKRERVRGLSSASDFLGVGEERGKGRAWRKGQLPLASVRASFHLSARDSREGVCWHLINIICMTAGDSDFAQLFEGLGALAAFHWDVFWKLIIGR